MFTTFNLLPLVLLCGALLLGPPAAQARGGGHYGDDRTESHAPRTKKLSPEQREKAEQILEEARPRLQQIRQEMREKMQELKEISYNSESDPEDLARLGRELQEQRNALLTELRALDARLQTEVGAGAQMRGYHGRGCAGLERAAPERSPYAEAPNQQ